LIVDGTSIIAIPGGGSQASAALFTVGSQTLIASTDIADPSAIVVGGTTLSRGGPAATIGDAVVSAGSGGVVIDGTQTVKLPVDKPRPAAAALQATFATGSSTITTILATGRGNAIVVDGTTLSQGGSAITVDGTQLSVGTAGLVVDDSHTILVSNFEAAATSEAVFTLGGSAITAVAASGTGAAIVIDGTTLSRGGSAIIVDGMKLSAGSARLVVDGTRTISLSSVESEPTPTDVLRTVLTLGDSTITAVLPSESGDAIVVNGTTLSVGGSAITLDGTELSAGTVGLVVEGTRTVSRETTTDESRATEGSGTNAPDTPTVTDLGSTSDPAQSAGRRAFCAQGEWLSVLLGVCTLLGVAWG
jgi:hypothetical protein